MRKDTIGHDDPYIGLAISYFQQKNVAEANIYYQKAVEIEPLFKQGLEVVEKEKKCSYTPKQKLIFKRVLDVLEKVEAPAPARHPPPKETGRDGRFIAHDKGGVMDTKTNLMWAAKDNGSNINLQSAKSYCANYRGGDYTDWRMPTQDELAGLYASGAHKDKIRITGYVWTLETGGFGADLFSFGVSNRGWSWDTHSPASNGRALPVRSGK